MSGGELLVVVWIAVSAFVIGHWIGKCQGWRWGRLEGAEEAFDLLPEEVHQQRRVERQASGDAHADAQREAAPWQ